LAFISTGSGSEQYTVYCNQTTGSFAQQFPAGAYIAAIQATGFGSTSGTGNTGFYNIGTFTVSEDGQTVDLAMPDIAVLSGTVGFSGDRPASVTIRAVDASVPSIDSRNYIRFSNTTTSAVDSGVHPEQFITPSVWTSPGTGFTGTYDMSLAKGGNYQLSLSYPVYASPTDTVAAGTLTYTPTANEVALNGDGTFDLANIPSPTELVTLSGSFGAQILGSHIIAVSTSLLGMPNMTYRAETFSAGTSGSWTLKVPKGNYIVYMPAYGTPFVVP